MFVSVAMLGACSSIDEFFSPEPDAVTVGGAPKPGSQGVPGKDQPTPNLATVPDQAPKPQTTAEERQKIANQLIADNRQAQYAEKVNRPDQPEVPPPARTPNVPAKGKTDQKSDSSAKPEPSVSTTAPTPSAPTASVQMSAAPTQGAPPPAAPAAAPGSAAPPAAPSPLALQPETQAPPAAPSPPALQPATPAAAAPPPSTMTGPIPSPPPLPPVLQEAQAPAAAAAPAPASAPVPPAIGAATPMPAAPPAAAPMGPPETVVISGRSARPLSEYVRKSAISALVASVYFPADSTQIKPEDVTVLRQLALEQTKRGGTFRLVSVARSQVADARAQEVAKILIDRGVNPGRVYAGAVPQTDPTYGQLRAESDPANRRVDVYLDY